MGTEQMMCGAAYHGVNELWAGGLLIGFIGVAAALVTLMCLGMGFSLIRDSIYERSLFDGLMGLVLAALSPAMGVIAYYALAQGGCLVGAAW